MDLQSMHDVLDEARQAVAHIVHEMEIEKPAVEQSAAAVLAAAGAPAPIVAAVDALVAELLNHFSNQQPAPDEAPAPAVDVQAPEHAGANPAPIL